MRRRTNKAAAPAHAPRGGPAPWRGHPAGAAASRAAPTWRQALLKQLVRVGVRHRGKARGRKDMRWVEKCASQAVHDEVLWVKGVQVGRWRGRQAAAGHSLAVGSLRCTWHAYQSHSFRSSRTQDLTIFGFVCQIFMYARHRACCHLLWKVVQLTQLWQDSSKGHCLGGHTILHKAGKVLVDVAAELCLVSVAGCD